jgi:glycerol-3-phosphate acyltransferase PlsY
VFFHFQGGKGVATAFGLLFALHWPSGLVAGVVWLLVFALTRISSLASLSAFVVAPACIFAWLPQAFWPMLALSLVMILRHRSNLQKLLRGEELGFRKKD